MQNYGESPCPLEGPPTVERAGEFLKRGACSEALSEYLALFQQGHTEFAAIIGWLYRRQPNKNLDLSIQFYEKAASAGSAYAQHALGAIYIERGDDERAIEWYLKAVDNGRKQCLFLIYKSYKNRGIGNKASEYLALSAGSGNPYAIRDTAYKLIAGGSGPTGIAKGVLMFLRNAPDLLAVSKKDVRLREEMTTDI